MEATDEVYQVLSGAKALARRYYHLTGKPLGVTGEVAEYEAARILNLELELARQAGYDATETRDGLTIRIQTKGCTAQIPLPHSKPFATPSISNQLITRASSSSTSEFAC
jgi:hypothetical protein